MWMSGRQEKYLLHNKEYENWVFHFFQIGSKTKSNVMEVVRIYLPKRVLNMTSTVPKRSLLRFWSECGEDFSDFHTTANIEMKEVRAMYSEHIYNEQTQ